MTIGFSTTPSRFITFPFGAGGNKPVIMKTNILFLLFLAIVIFSCKKGKTNSNNQNNITYSIDSGQWQIDSTIDKKGKLYDYAKENDEQGLFAFNLKDSIITEIRMEPGEANDTMYYSPFCISNDSIFAGKTKSLKSKFVISGNVLYMEGSVMEMPKSWFHLKK